MGETKIPLFVRKQRTLQEVVVFVFWKPWIVIPAEHHEELKTPLGVNAWFPSPTYSVFLGCALHAAAQFQAGEGFPLRWSFWKAETCAVVVHLLDESSSQHMFNAWMNELFKCIWRLWQTPVNRQILIKMSFGTRYLPFLQSNYYWWRTAQN